jgi:hypothetical protein
MMGRSRDLLRASSLVALLVGVLLAGRAWADEPAFERVHLIYSASPGCVNESDFGRQVGARIHRPVEWVRDPSARVISVELVQGEAESHGTVEMRSPPPVTRRDFVAATCAEVSAALSLVVALALDPNARLELPAEGSAEPAPANATFPDEAATPPPPTLAAPAAAPPPQHAPSPAPAAPPERPWRFFVGPLAGVGLGYAPVALVTLGPTLGLRSSSKATFSPRLQLSGHWGETGTTGPSAAEGTFGWTFARLEGCPIHWRLTPLLALAPCALVELGEVRAEGATSGTVVAEEAHRFWASLGLSLTMVAHAGDFFTQLTVHAATPLTRYEFAYFDPLFSVHQPSVIVGGGTIAVGIEL